MIKSITKIRDEEILRFLNVNKPNKMIEMNRDYKHNEKYLYDDKNAKLWLILKQLKHQL